MRESRLFLIDILKAAEDIKIFTSGVSFKEFVIDGKTISAVLYQFAIMGEVTKMLPDQVRAQYPDIPWRSIAGCEIK